MSYFKYIFLLIFGLLSISGVAQQKIIDSLERIVNNRSVPDKDKIVPLSELILCYTGDTVKAVKLGKTAISLARKQKENEYGVHAYSNLGVLYMMMGDIKKVYSMMDSCMWYIDHSSDAEVIGLGLSRIGGIKLRLGNKDGLKDVFKSLEVVKKGKQKNKIQFHNYYILTEYYFSDFANSEKYSKLGVEAAVKSKIPTTICSAWSIRGIRFLAEYEDKSGKVDLLNSAISCFRKALEVYDKHPGYIRGFTVINILSNITTSYHFKNELKPDKANLDSIDYYLQKTLSIPKENSAGFLKGYYWVLINAELNKKNYDSAERYCLEAIEILSHYNGYYRDLYEYCRELASIYEKKRQFDKSTEYLKKSLEYYQKFYDDKYIKIGQQNHVKYEVEKKEQEIEFRKKQNFLYLGIAVILTLGVILLYFFYSYRMRYLRKTKEEAKLLAKIKEEEARVLEVEKCNAELMARIKEEEASKLQKEVLAQHMQVEHKNKILENLHENINADPESGLRNLKRLMKNESLLDKSFDDFKKILNDIHPDFYTKLQDKANQKLTALDLKYCVYIFMKMPSKEMSDLLNVELKTIRMNKYRLKQKLGLSKEENLEEFIWNIL